MAGSTFASDAASTAPATSERVIAHRSGRPMATDCSVQISTPSRQFETAEAAAGACMAWLDEVDQRLSRFRPESELSRLNAAAGRWVAVSEMLWDVARLAVTAAAASAGLFDPLLLRQLEALGYDQDFATIAHREVAGSRLPGPSLGKVGQAWRAVEFDTAGQRIRIPEGTGMDLGGIAKGWAADVALTRYCAGFPGALINVGGDLRARGGPQPGEAWTVGIEDPRAAALSAGLEWRRGEEPRRLAGVIAMSRGGLATSGALRRWWRREGARAHHLIDPRTGRPANIWMPPDAHENTEQHSLPPLGARTDRPAGSAPADPHARIATATALAPTAAAAEVAAKVALLRGYPAALEAVESAWRRHGAVGPATNIDAGVALVLTFGSGKVATSANLNEYLTSWGTDAAAIPLVVTSGNNATDATGREYAGR